MVECVAEDMESWLPTEFLTQEELLLMDKKKLDKNELKPPSLGIPSEFPHDFDSLYSSCSALSSPMESVAGSTEAESSSDEEDFLVGLTRRLAQQLAVKPEKKWVMAGSPESTLSGIGSWSVSSNGSPNGVLSPPTTPFEAKDDTWDLISAAAGEVARMKKATEAHNNHNNNNNNKFINYQGKGLLGAAAAARPHAPAFSVEDQITGLYSRHCLGHDVSQMNQYHPHHMRQEQLLKPHCSSDWGRYHQAKAAAWQAQFQHKVQPQQIQSRGRSVAGYESGRGGRPTGLPQSAWPPLHVQRNRHQRQLHPQNSNSGLRAVFLGGSGVKRECTGTGVFLPRRYGTTPEPKKKSACSPVLLPEKVVQALNLNLGGMNMGGAYPSDYDALMARRNAILALQNRSLCPEVALNHELCLPKEWTY